MYFLQRCSVLVVALTTCVIGSPIQQHDHRIQPYSIPLTRDPLFGFLGNVSVGTPTQLITAFVDWTWLSMYVVSTVCAGNPSNTANCLSPRQAIFNQTLSSTYKNKSSIYPSRTWNPNEFFGSLDFTVDYASDIQTVGPASSRIILQISDFQPYYFTSAVFPFSGIFGLSPVFPSDDPSTQSPFYQMWKSGAWSTPYVAFVYCYKSSKALCNGYDAIQTLGGFDTRVACKGVTWYQNVGVPEVNQVDFTFSPAVYNYWAIRVTQLSIGHEVQQLNHSYGGAAAIFDSASRGRGLPLSANAYKVLVAKTKATVLNSTLSSPPNNGAQAFYQVDCTKVNSFPSIKYQFAGDGRKWEVSGANYVEQVSANVCVLNVRVVGDGDFLLGNFGETFVKDKYVVFDFQGLRVGLADVCDQ